MSAVTVIKISHAHPSQSFKQEISSAKKGNFPACYKAIAEGKCLICEYQLAKDADANYASFQVTHPCEFGSLIAFVYTDDHTEFYSVFENRGPPFAWSTSPILLTTLLMQ